MFRDGPTTKSAIDKLLPIMVAIGGAYFIDSYSKFIEKYNAVGAALLVFLLIVFVALWELSTTWLVKRAFRVPSERFVGTWVDYAWEESHGPVPRHEMIIGGAWINVVETNSGVEIEGVLFNRDGLRRQISSGRFTSKAIYIDQGMLKFEYVGGSGTDVPAGFGWYKLVATNAAHKTPAEWRGYFLKKGEKSWYSKARRVTEAELKQVQTEAEMARLIASHCEGLDKENALVPVTHAKQATAEGAH